MVWLLKECLMALFHYYTVAMPFCLCKGLLIRCMLVPNMVPGIKYKEKKGRQEGKKNERAGRKEK